MRASLCLLLVACSGPAAMPDAGDGSTPTPDAATDAFFDAPKDVAADVPPIGCDAGGCVPVVVFRKLFFGDTDRSFVVSPSAWKEYGLDIDGKTTTQQSIDVCQRYQGAPSSVQVDGNGGIDNSFGANFVPLFQSAASQPNLSKPTSDMIEQGLAPSFSITLKGIDASQNIPSLMEDAYKVFGPTPPSWNGSDTFGASSRSVTNQSLQSPLIGFSKGSMTSRVYTSGPATLNLVTLEVAIGGLAFLLPLRRLVVKMTIAPDNSTASGVLAGVMNTDELIAAMKQVFGQISPTLCSGSTFDALSLQARQMSDIMDDGTQDPQKTCNAVSIGLGFEAVYAQISSLVMDSPPPMPCQ